MRPHRSLPQQSRPLSSSPHPLLALVLSALAWLAPACGAAGEAAPTVGDAPAAAPSHALFERVLALNQVQEPELDPAAARAAFVELVERARTALATAATPRDRVAALARILLEERQVTYLSNQYWRDSTLAASLVRRQGNCLATSTLFVLVGDALALPIRLVVVPRHAFVRWDDGATRINIETTDRGSELPDAHYLRAVDPEDIAGLGWGRSLDQAGFRAELLEVAAMHRRSQNRLVEARALLAEVEQLAPGRKDLRLAHIVLEADASNDRDAAWAATVALLEDDPPPSVRSAALRFLATNLGARGDHVGERDLLLRAFAAAGRDSQAAILQDLAFCHRSLRDARGAVRYMELRAALVQDGDPERADILYGLAILQKEDGRLDDALASIGQALAVNPESWYLRTIQAGYLVHAGQRAEGLRRYAAIDPPRDDAEFHACMRAWFQAVCGEREAFFAAFAEALGQASGTGILDWVGQDPDLDAYRDDPRFAALVDRHRRRLLGAAAPTAQPEPEPEPAGARP